MNSLFKDKKKNTLAICFTSVYALCLILTINFKKSLFLLNFAYALNSLILALIPLITPVLVLVFLLTLKKEYRFKKWLFPVAFGVKFVTNLISLILGIGSLQYLLTNPLQITMYFISVLMTATFGLMFVGTLFNFKYLKLLKIGAIAFVVLSLIFYVIEFISLGGMAYFQIVPQNASPINFMVLIKFIAQSLFYIGIFILTLKKENTTKE
jgi:hypothetical protein